VHQPLLLLENEAASFQLDCHRLLVLLLLLVLTADIKRGGCREQLWRGSAAAGTPRPLVLGARHGSAGQAAIAGR
jgi:hypothetical protein